MGRVLGVGDEGEVARSRLLDGGDPLDADGAVAPQLTAETLRDVAEEHAHPATAPGVGVGPPGLGLAGPPELTAPLSWAPSRTTRTWASTLPWNRAFSVRVTAAGLDLSLELPGDLGRVGVHLGLDP